MPKKSDRTSMFILHKAEVKDIKVDHQYLVRFSSFKFRKYEVMWGSSSGELVDQNGISHRPDGINIDTVYKLP